MGKKYYTFNDYEKEGGGIFSNNLYQTTELNLNALNPKQTEYKAKAVKAECKSKKDSGNMTCADGLILKYLLKLELKIYNEAVKKEKPSWFRKLFSKSISTTLFIPEELKKKHLKIIKDNKLNTVYLNNLCDKLIEKMTAIITKINEDFNKEIKDDLPSSSIAYKERFKIIENLSIIDITNKEHLDINKTYRTMTKKDFMDKYNGVFFNELKDDDIKNKIIMYFVTMNSIALCILFCMGIIITTAATAATLGMTAVVLIGAVLFGIMIVMIIASIYSDPRTNHIYIYKFRDALVTMVELFTHFKNNLPQGSIKEICIKDKLCKNEKQMKLIKIFIKASENILKETADRNDTVIEKESSALSSDDVQEGYVSLDVNPH
jgi:hypothetical protein